MPTINENIAELQQKTTNLISAHNDIKDAIISKGGEVSSGDKFSDFPDDIGTIRKDLTSININENGVYKNGTLDTVTGNTYPIEIVANGSPIVSITMDGDTVQNETPTPTAPVDVNGVGEMTRNLFDKNTTPVSLYYQAQREVITTTTGVVSIIMPVSPNTTYTFNNPSGNRNRICETETVPELNDTVINYIASDGNISITLTTSNNTHYILWWVGYQQTYGDIAATLSVNLGSEALPYEPYGYKIPISCGGVTTDVYLGEVPTTRYIKKLVLDGTEDWKLSSTANQFYIDSVLDAIPQVDPMCTHFKGVSSLSADNQIVISASQKINIRTTYIQHNLTDWINYLQQQYTTGTPVTVWYVLETPETDTINEPLMKIGDYADQLTLTDSDITIPTVTGNNVVDYDLTVKPSSTSLTYYKLGINKTIVSDTLPIEFESNGNPLESYSIMGNTVQNGTPTPSNPIQPQSCGERTGNLLDYTTVEGTTYTTVTQISGGISVSGQYYALFRTVQFEVGKSYTMSWKANKISGTASLSWRFHYADNTYSSMPSSGESLIAEKKVTELLLYVSNGASCVVEFTEIMLNAGSTPLPYEPYGQYKIPISSASTTTNVYLGEVATTRYIKKLVLTGTESWVAYSGNYFSSVIDSNSRQYYLCFCTHLESTYSSGIYVDSGGSRLKVFSASVVDVATTVSEWKTYLQQQYAAGTPVTVWYVLATPETATINEPLMKIGDYADSIVDTQTQIPTVYGDNTFDVGTTIKPSSVSITYDDINTIGYNEINVDVPNTYTVEDEGKVVNNNALVPQTAYPSTITSNNTYDTTLYNEITVDVPPINGNKVRFIDYDGTILHEYTPTQFAALTEMPVNPSHAGLTAQGWNWSLSDAKTYVNKYGSLDIGQMYITDDGKTRIYITLTEGFTSPLLQLYLNANSELDIDWGDDTTHSTFTSTTADYVSERHNYATPGDYVIAISVTSGSFMLKSSANNTTILGDGKGNPHSTDRIYNNAIKKIEIGRVRSGINTLNNAFAYCSSLKSISLPRNFTMYDQNVFAYCSSLTSITIPSSVITIGQYTFCDCCSLTSIIINYRAISIEQYAFAGCYSLQSITIPDSVTSIDQCAFQNCSSLHSITIGDSGINIGEYAFYGCSALTSILGVDNINNYAFQSCYSLTSIIIPDGVTSIGGSAFANCYSLTSVTIPDSVTSIDQYAFQDCRSLLSITIPDGVTSIDNGAFYSCDSLLSVTIGSGVTSIGNSAFYFSTSINTLKFKPTTPPTVSNSSTFTFLDSCTILVPINTYSAYTTATNYPSSSTYTYLVFGTYESGVTLPSTSTDNYILAWYATIADAIAQTNPITTGNGNEVYARCVSA